jgi:hypothetical protein
MSTSEASVQVLPSYQEYQRPALTVQWLDEVNVTGTFDSAIKTSDRVFWQSPLASRQSPK